MNFSCAWLVALGLIGAPAVALADDQPGVGDAPWLFKAKVYGWLPEAPAAITVNQQEVANLPESLDTIIDDMTVAFMGEFELHKGPLRFFISPVYFDGEDDSHFTGLAGERRQVTIKEDIWLIDYGVGWEFGPWQLGEGGEYPTLRVAPFVGARFFRDEFELDVDPGLFDEGLRVRTTVEFNTPFVGLGAYLKFSERWSFEVEGDYGVADASEVDETYQVSGILGYHFRIRERSAQWFAGYRYLELDLENDPIAIDLEVKGPVLGFGMEF